MSVRREEVYYTSKIAKNVLSERTDIMNYVPTKMLFLYRTDVIPSGRWVISHCLGGEFQFRRNAESSTHYVMLIL